MAANEEQSALFEKMAAQVQDKREKSSIHIADQSLGNLVLLTWNVDGIDEDDLHVRTLAVAEQINNLGPHIVCLQEVVSVSLGMLTKYCKGYKIYHHSIASYFCAILIRKMPNLSVLSQLNVEYPGSKMGRYLMKIDVEFGDKQIIVLTSHLESMQASKQERISQLNTAFQSMIDAEDKTAVILAGDLNLREDEVKKVGGLTNGIKDAWIEAGCEVNTKFTWDMKLNDNLVFRGNQKPRCRFDRVYYKSDGTTLLRKFDLIGKQRLSSCDRFSSDHWGILCEFSFDG